jgi:ABC-2 type transport system ATP-binding protein
MILPPIIEVNELSYSFGQKPVLDAISMTIKARSIYGFLGINGAGKTTTLRLLLGLLRPKKADIRLFGLDLSNHRLDILRRVGSLIEQPSLYAHLSAKENLEIFRLSYGCSKSAIDKVLHIVGLTNTGSKKVKAYSLGMKQRLAIAVALIHGPDILILDEPTNGLDPSGIIEVRQMIRRLNEEEGLTIVVSSHLLSEVEKMATNVGIIHKGKMMFEGEIQELQRIRTGRMSIVAEVSNIETALAVLNPRYTAVRDGDTIKLDLNDRASIALANSLLVNNGVDVYRLSAKTGDLEDLFISIIND